MPLKLGKLFDRCYNLRIPLLSSFYDINIFFDRKSTFLLFGITPDIKNASLSGAKINMFKNLEGSKFCEIFLDLHNYSKQTLDIVNQFKAIKTEYENDISQILNETITLSKVVVGDRSFYDYLNIYGFSIRPYLNEFIFIVTERQSISVKLNKKVVRTSGIQIATTQTLNILNDFYENRSK